LGDTAAPIGSDNTQLDSMELQLVGELNGTAGDTSDVVALVNNEESAGVDVSLLNDDSVVAALQQQQQ